MLAQVNEFILNIIYSAGVFAPIIACLLILFESMLPVLPLCAFITINFLYFGNICGFFISWSFTCLGCILSYFLVRKGFQSYRWDEEKEQKTLNKLMKYIKDLSYTKFIILIALPFTPAFLINIAAGLCNMSFKKFSFCILLGKIFMVYFWGYIGTSLVESLKDPIILIKVILMLIVAYILGLFLNKMDGKPVK